MNKKGMETSTVVGLIIFLVVVAIVLGVLYYQNRILTASSNAEAINVWVTTLTATKGTEVVAQTVPPVIDLEAPLEIERKEQLVWSGAEPPKAYKGIANSMVDCWNAFDKGQSDFLSSINRDVFCFPCRAVVFSDDLKREDVSMVNFRRYLNEYPLGDRMTYAQILANDKTYKMDEFELQNDRISTQKNVYIMFVGMSGRGAVNVMTNLIGAGNVLSEGGELKERIEEPTTQLEPGKYSLPTLEANIKEQDPTLSGVSSELKVTEKDSSLVIKVQSSGDKQESTKRVASAVAGIAMASGAILSIIPVTMPIGVALLSAGTTFNTLEVTFGDKPYSATVILADQDKVNVLCNS